MPDRPRRGDLVLVRWRDSCAMGNSWQSRRGVRRHRPSKIQSVGWVAKATRKRLVLYAGDAGGGTSSPWSEVVAIPWGCVTKVVRLRAAD
jgi:hypothetical protein